ncbi:MAG: alpha/beta fold hydrolase [Clostridiales bacterium]|nr:alpha/beta fold hydrolase [Clostridiales bacterium]
MASSSPQITVLTHGFGGAASHWSNNGNGFAYDQNSLFERLNIELSKIDGAGANVYWANMQSSKSFYLVDLKDQKNIDVYGKYQIVETISTITDISKHIIIIFDSSNGGAYNYQIYEEFNYMISKIVYDIKCLSGGELPKINLVGHSRGGVTNLQYALDHPDMVASMFSLGTPYFGSDTASTDIGAMVAGGGIGLDDIIDRNRYLEYFYRWNDGYDRLYTQIDAHALGGYSDSDFVFDALIESDSEIVESNVTDSVLMSIKWAIKSLPGVVRALDGEAETLDFLLSLLRDEDYDESELESYIQIITDMQYFNDDEDMGFWEDLWDNIVHNIAFVGCPYFMNDLLVDLPSQIGIDEHSDTYRSYMFKIYTKCFREDDYEIGTSKKLSSPSMPAIVHNLEARDDDFINYIIANIELGARNNVFLYKQTSATTAILTGYCGNILTGNVVLPSIIDGFIITNIASDLFKGMGTNISSIAIPNSICTISNGAFVGMRNLQNVTFASGSQLSSIGSQAFWGCSNLTSITIPATVTSIGSHAFADCSNLQSVTFAENSQLTNIDYQAFLDCSSLESIEIPAGVTSITTGMLRDCTSLESVTIASGSQLTSIGQNAFTGCSSLQDIELSNSLTTIANQAFYGCTNLTEISLPASVTNIGAQAFSGCSSLEKVVMYNQTTVPTLGTNAFNSTASNLKIYVPYSLENAYKTATNWNSYASKIDGCYIENGKAYVTESGTVNVADQTELVTLYSYNLSDVWADYGEHLYGEAFIAVGGSRVFYVDCSIDCDYGEMINCSLKIEVEATTSCILINSDKQFVAECFIEDGILSVPYLEIYNSGEGFYLLPIMPNTQVIEFEPSDIFMEYTARIYV